MMRILDRYVVRVFLQSYALCALFVLGIFVVIDFFAKIDEFLVPTAIRASGRSVLAVIAEYYVLSLPLHFAIVAPSITLMAGMFAVTRLSRSNELNSIVASGVSIRRALLPVFVLAALVSAALAAEQEWLIPRIASEQRALQRLIKGHDPATLSGIEELRDGRGNRIQLEKFEPERNRATRLNATLMGDVRGQVLARAAEYRDGSRGVGWYLEDGERHLFGPDGGFVAEPVTFFEETDLVPRQILLACADPLTMSLSDLADNARRHPERPDLRVLLYQHVTAPLSNVILLLLGLPLVLNRKIRSPFVAVAVCIVICGAFYATDFVCKDVGKRGEMDPFVASFLPLAIFGAVGFALYDSVRT